MNNRSCAILLAAAGLAFGASAAGATKSKPVDAARIQAADQEPGSWMSTGRTYGEQRFSPLNKINVDTVGKLGLAWSYRLEVDRATEGTSIVVDGTMYTTSAFSIVYALDPRSGKLLWKYDPKVPRDRDRDGCCDVGNRGVAVWKGKVYVGSYDGRLIALDAKTGHKAWEIDTVIDHDRSYTITGAPRVIKGKVIIGNGGAEFGVRGYVSAYEADTGKLAWRFFTVPGDPKLPPENKAMEMAQKTWFGNSYWTQGGGGTAWDSFAYDPELDLLYIGTGNGAMWNRGTRSEDRGDNLFLSSIVAVRPDTGEYVWHYQTTPGDTWDYTATQSIILADLTINGTPRKVLMQAPKNAFFYVIDRETGELLSAEKYSAATWASKVDLKTGRPIESPDADWSKKAQLVLPGPIGAHNWQPMSFSPLTGLVYIPTQTAPAVYVPNPDAKYGGRGTWNLGMQPIGLPEDPKELKPLQDAYKGRLVAWDPIAQKEVWGQDYASAWNGGTLATGGNLVFQGTADGRFVAYSADKGIKLWESPANSGVMAGPIAYEIGGEQYITVLAGWGGAYPLALGAISTTAKVRPEARVLTYKLGGKASLPPPNNTPAKLPEPPALTADAASVDIGRNLFNGYCGMCHGPNAMSGGVVPDLRYLTPQKHAIFAGIVAGALAARGMPAMTDVLKPDQIEAIHQYVIKRAQDLKSELAATPVAATK